MYKPAYVPPTSLSQFLKGPDLDDFGSIYVTINSGETISSIASLIALSARSKQNKTNKYVIAIPTTKVTK